MLCSNPISINAGLVGCGQCLACRINKRREWVHRIMLESSVRGDNAFVTLSYNDENLPRLEDGRGNLVPKDMQDWLKRFRKSIEPIKVRYYGVGEYGDDTERPHFHFALFNYPSCVRGITYGGNPKLIYDEERHKTRTFCCAVCDAVYRSWGKGAVVLGTLTEDSANYIAGYVVKKMTRPEDIRLEGRHPEFARMSLRPGIGSDAMHDVASTVLEFDLVESQGDVPSALRHGTRLLPLGRYLRGQLRLFATGTKDVPEITKKAFEDEQQRLRDLQMASPGATPLKKIKLEEDYGKLRNLDARHNIFKKRKSL